MIYVRKPDRTIVSKNREGQPFVVNTETGDSFLLSDSSWLTFSLLDGKIHAVDELKEKANCDYPDVPWDEIRQDSIDLLESLQEQQLVLISEKRDDLDFFPLRSLHIELTMKCNERCIHCYLPNQVKNAALALSLSQFCNIIDQFVAMNGQVVTLSGGEPLMNPDFKAMLQYCKYKGLRVNLFSNLTLMTDEIIEMLKGMDVGIVQVSIYSLTPAVHDRITKQTGSLTKSMVAIEHLLAAGIHVAIACPVMKQNKDSVPDLMVYAKSKGINMRANSLIIPKTDGDDSFSRNNCLNRAETKEMFCQLLQKDYDFSVGCILDLSNKAQRLCEDCGSFLNSAPCDAGMARCCISPTGDVFPCPDWHSYLLGNVFETPLKTLWEESPKLHLIRQLNRHRNFRKCLSCEALDYCKLCLMQNDMESHGHVLIPNEHTCMTAFLTKEVIEAHESKGMTVQ